MIKGYDKEYIVSDGDSRYSLLDIDEKYKDKSHAFCSAHLRRKILEAIKHDNRSELVIDLIDKLFEMENMTDGFII